ncbi:hypothetical protein ACIBH1_32485 [Nonomuraea sp. NPDC050663]|uniref:hypothetical protein n=1 Tax=Nonomuraea sp. NPDC050663 TaxID=3364370 RepID=UPI003792CEFD
MKVETRITRDGTYVASATKTCSLPYDSRVKCTATAIALNPACNQPWREEVLLYINNVYVT